jgi:hypothetical protein
MAAAGVIGRVPDSPVADHAARFGVTAPWVFTNSE